ncbi:glycoside hydrolase family 32 protein [Corynebacterium canis]|uniref:beta-fructofuranosidase n=1 Tax=Corynebacterium canis TaxID=679663 RepID=A0A5C5UFK4_9CORY|nr:glycoside hydrolase family 32 protein [Corynebacterium canis]TWT24994.1 glycoside hydrolase family 32 protein [Corynebacterium canis]WJY74885.1 Sucrose-6-phosphate hydrolase [Corynebacterium canis]
MPEHHRPQFHLTPPIGRLNDPNGLYFENGELHAYFQHDPQWPISGKRTGWGHAKACITDDGAPERWEHLPDALYPAVDYDTHGCYSGSAVLVDGELELFYTGNAKPNNTRRATQNLVRVSQRHAPHGGAHIRAAENPLIDGPAPGYTAHYRDPQILFRDGQWLMLLGAQREDETGAVVLYTSPDRRTWDFAGEIEFDCTAAHPGVAPDLIPGGYMWECPNLIRMEDEADGKAKDVMIVLPQGLEQVGHHYANNHQCGYIVGQLKGTKFQVERGFTELDYGTEFYAPQVVHNAPEPWLMGWMGLPDQDDQPTKADHWVHALTMVRRLRLVDGVVLQQPRASISGLQVKRGSTLQLIDAVGVEIMRFTLGDDWVELNRSAQEYHEGGDVRRAPLEADSELIDAIIVVDGSCVEAFFNKGMITMSARAFAKHPFSHISVIDVT